MKKLTKANEDYLEAILLLSGGDISVKSVRIAEFLNVSKPAVNKAMAELSAMNLINKSSYSYITLTEEGRKIAQSVYNKHIKIKEFLLKIGVSELVAEEDCCKIEHIVSEETIEKIIDATNKML